MAELLLEWLNAEGRLSRPVASIEGDFRNGYLLGELLAQHNQLPSFGQFLDRHTPDAKITNYTRLEPALRHLRIPFDAKAAAGMMEGKAGVAANIVYQLKARFEAMQRTCAPVSLREARPGSVPLPKVHDHAAKPSFDRATRAIFEARIRKLVPSANEQLMAMRLERFASERPRQRKEERAGREADGAPRLCRTQTTRPEALPRGRKGMELAGGDLRSWTLNQSRAVERRRMEEAFRASAERTRQRRRAAAKDAAALDAQAGVAAFEERRIRPSAPAAPDVLPEESGSEREAASRLAEQRRRRFLAAAEERLVSACRRREGALLARMLTRATERENAVEESEMRIKCRAELFEENRAFRERAYAARRRADAADGEARAAAAAAQAARARARALEIQMEQMALFEASRSAAKRERSCAVARCVLGGILDLAARAALLREARRGIDGGPWIPEAAWAAMKEDFSRGAANCGAANCISRDASATRVGNAAGAGAGAEGGAAHLDAAAVARFAEMLRGRVRAAPYPEGGVLSSPRSFAPQAIVRAAPEEALLGEVVASLRAIAAPLRGPPPPPKVRRAPLQVVLIGSYHCGKEAIAEEIAAALKLRAVSVDRLLEQAVRLAERQAAAGEAEEAPGGAPAGAEAPRPSGGGGELKDAEADNPPRGAPGGAMGAVAARVVGEALDAAMRKVCAAAGGAAGAENENCGADGAARVRDIGVRARRMMLEGEGVPDGLYVELLEQHLALLFPPEGGAGGTARGPAAPRTDADGGGKEAPPTRRCSAGGNAGPAPPAARTLPAAEGAAYRGFVLSDFPRSARQAALLDEMLSGFPAGQGVAHPYELESPFAPAAAGRFKPPPRGRCIDIAVRVERDAAAALAAAADAGDADAAQMASGMLDAHRSRAAALEAALLSRGTRVVDTASFQSMVAKDRLLGSEVIPPAPLPTFPADELERVSGVPRRLAAVLAGAWRDAEALCEDALAAAARDERASAERRAAYLRAIVAQFGRFVARETPLAGAAIEFQRFFNERCDAALRFSGAGVRELRLCLEEQRCRMWESIERREAENAALLRRVASNGFAEQQRAAIAARCGAVLHAELARLFTAAHLLGDYAAAAARPGTGLVPPPAADAPRKVRKAESDARAPLSCAAFLEPLEALLGGGPGAAGGGEKGKKGAADAPPEDEEGISFAAAERVLLRTIEGIDAAAAASRAALREDAAAFDARLSAKRDALNAAEAALSAADAALSAAAAAGDALEDLEDLRGAASGAAAAASLARQDLWELGARPGGRDVSLALAGALRGEAAACVRRVAALREAAEREGAAAALEWSRALEGMGAASEAHIGEELRCAEGFLAELSAAVEAKDFQRHLLRIGGSGTVLERCEGVLWVPEEAPRAAPRVAEASAGELRGEELARAAEALRGAAFAETGAEERVSCERCAEVLVQLLQEPHFLDRRTAAVERAAVEALVGVAAAPGDCMVRVEEVVGRLQEPGSVARLLKAEA